MDNITEKVWKRSSAGIARREEVSTTIASLRNGNRRREGKKERKRERVAWRNREKGPRLREKVSFVLAAAAKVAKRPISGMCEGILLSVTFTCSAHAGASRETVSREKKYGRTEEEIIRVGEKRASGKSAR